MAESFLFSITTSVLGKLGSVIVQEISQAWGFKEEMKRLEDTLTAARAVLLDAEDQQHKTCELKVWMGRLTDVCYAADDILDEFEVFALRRKVLHGGSAMKKVHNFFSSSNKFVFSFRMGYKIKEIRRLLDDIAADKFSFHPPEQRSDKTVPHKEKETYSFLLSSDIFGRDEEKESVINLLMGLDETQNVHFLPIVGIGGLGKTTLTRMVYNDDRITQHFHLSIWICVSNNFDVEQLIRKIITSAGGMPCDDSDIGLLHVCLRETLKDKRFLLVLDDVWNQDRVKWVEFSILLTSEVNGSKVIVTTRSQRVASIVATIPPYIMEGLPHKECLALFMRWAFRRGEEMQHPNLMKIGEEIVNKGNGVPLAVRTLGSLLFGKIDEREWLHVRDNEIWRMEQNENDILAALKLSYNCLPSHLKRCFAFCSIFPKNQKIYGWFLVYHWIAQGLIESSNPTKELEDVAWQHIQDLRSRSLFQDFTELGFDISFKMHDLVHDLALSVAQTEYLVVDSHIQRMHKKVRHLSFRDVDSLSGKFPSFLLELKNVLTIFMQFQHGRPNKAFASTSISRFKCLRMLDLRNSCFEKLPSSIGGLKHLRWLDLSFNNMIKWLPNSLCEVQSLETLGLYGCIELEKLPRSFGKLISLRRLWLTTKEKYLMAKMIGKLTSLRCLVIGECYNLEELFDDNGAAMRNLTYLRTLGIFGCKNLLSLPQGLKFLPALENLNIGDCGKVEIMMRDEEEEKGGILRGSNNLRSLRYLGIAEIPKLEALPQWLIQGSSATLKHLHLVDCENLTKLPENLNCLERLIIEDCLNLKALPEAMSQFTTLKEIQIYGCPDLMRRCQRETGKDWPKIANIPDVYIDGRKV